MKYETLLILLFIYDFSSVALEEEEIVGVIVCGKIQKDEAEEKKE